MATRMQQRRGTEAQWTTANPVLAAGEIGFETDTNQFKMGDGVNTWSDLTYFIDATTLSGSLDDYIPLASAGVADGVATLDSNGFVPASQLDIDVTADINAAIDGLIDGAPGVLDTLNELAAALGDDADFITTINDSIDGKADASHTHVIADITDYVDPNFNLDGGKANTNYGGITPIIGGNSGSF